MFFFASVMLLGPPADAHYPHDVAHYVAVSPDPAQLRLVTSLERIDLDILGRSEDGRSWAARLVQAVDDGEVTSAAFLTPDRLMLGTSKRGLLVSQDAGDTLLQVEMVTDLRIEKVAASPAVLTDGTAIAVGTTTLWRTRDAGQNWEAALTATGAGFYDVDFSPNFTVDKRICALEALWVWCSDDAGQTWRQHPAPRPIFRLSVGSDRRLWGATRGRGLTLSRDDGESWEDAGFPGEDLTAVAELSDGLLLVAKADEAAWRSTDLGDTWDMAPVYSTGWDQSVDGINSFEFAEGPDGAIYLACWPGLARSDDRGRTYTFYNTEPVQNGHSVALTEGVDGALWAWVGTYGGGPVLTRVDRAGAVLFPDLPLRFTRNTPTTPSWKRDGTAIFDEGMTTWRTMDHGESWELIEQMSFDDPEKPDVHGVALAPNTTLDPFLLVVTGQGASQFRSSENFGDTWTTGSQAPPCESFGMEVAISPWWPEESRAWAACGGRVYQTLDRGLSWSEYGDTGAFIFDIVERPDGVLLVATSDGLWRMDDHTSIRTAFAGVLVNSVAVSTDPQDNTVFALVPTEGWMRSEDKGESWTALPAPTADVPRTIAMSPFFPTDGTVAVAGYGGAWASTDRGESWHSIYLLESYESEHDAFRTIGSWTHSPSWPGTSGRAADLTTEVGASKTLQFFGVGAEVLAPASAEPGKFSIYLDNVPAQTRSLPNPTGVIWTASGLAEGWHSLRIELLEGTGTLDAVRVTRAELAPTGDSEVLPPEEDTAVAPEARCGCAGTEAGSLLLLPLLWRRRRNQL